MDKFVKNDHKPFIIIIIIINQRNVHTLLNTLSNDVLSSCFFFCFFFTDVVVSWFPVFFTERKSKRWKQMVQMGEAQNCLKFLSWFIDCLTFEHWVQCLPQLLPSSWGCGPVIRLLPEPALGLRWFGTLGQRCPFCIETLPSSQLWCTYIQQPTVNRGGEHINRTADFRRNYSSLTTRHLTELLMNIEYIYEYIQNIFPGPFLNMKKFPGQAWRCFDMSETQIRTLRWLDY